MLRAYNSVLNIPAKNRAKLEDYIASEDTWFHTFTFDGDLTTPGRDPSAKKLHHMGLPLDMTGMSVLDVGAYDGYVSFHCEKRGASKVVAADRFVWDWPGSSARSNFDAVHTALGSKVQSVSSNVEDLATTLNGETFDIVMFLGVLYHAPDMVRYLQNIAAATKTVCVLETYLDALDEPGSRAALYSPAELNNDSSNWWGPNLQATATMLRRVGFNHIEFVSMWDVNTKNSLEGKSWEGPIKSGRAVFHAYK